jgi:dTDP-4-amino-4,6-dideoxygalactose transaminase
LKADGILSRRYFYPLISDMSVYRGLPSSAAERLPIAKATADKVLCLPIYPDLTAEAQERIMSAIRMQK